jgi:hypothetical protein
MTLFQKEVGQNDPNKNKVDAISKYAPILDTAVKDVKRKVVFA